MSAVKETLQQQTGRLHYGLHDNYAFLQNAGKQLYFSNNIAVDPKTIKIRRTVILTIP